MPWHMLIMLVAILHLIGGAIGVAVSVMGGYTEAGLLSGCAVVVGVTMLMLRKSAYDPTNRLAAAIAVGAVTPFTAIGGGLLFALASMFVPIFGNGWAVEMSAALFGGVFCATLNVLCIVGFYRMNRRRRVWRGW